MKWTKEQIKELKEKYFYYLEHKKEAESYFGKDIQLIKMKASSLGITSMKINKNCSQFLGCHVAERVLSHVFKEVERMPIKNKGFDFICNKGKKIDVKASCLHKNTNYVLTKHRNDNYKFDIYTFNIKYNKIADYFLCIGFDNRENLNPQHVWLIKSDHICIIDERMRMFRDMNNLNIRNNPEHLKIFSMYELTDKLKETTDCCSTLKSNNESKEVYINE